MKIHIDSLNTSVLWSISISLVFITAFHVIWYIRKGWLAPYKQQAIDPDEIYETNVPLSSSDSVSGTKPTSVLDILTSNEIFQYVDRGLIQQYANCFGIASLRAGEPVQVDHDHISFIVEGSVRVHLPEVLPVQGPPLKIIGHNQLVTPILHVLSILVEELSIHYGQEFREDHRQGITKFTFSAAENTSLAILPRSTLTELVRISPESTLLMIDNICHRYHFVTLPFAETYLSLGRDIMQYDYDLSKTEALTEVTGESTKALLDTLAKTDLQQFLSFFLPRSPIFDNEPEIMAVKLPENDTFPPRQSQGQVRKGSYPPIQPQFSASAPLRIVIPSAEANAQARGTDTGTKQSVLGQLERNILFSPTKRLPDAIQMQVVKLVLSRLLSEAAGSEQDAYSGNFEATQQVLTLQQDFENAIQLYCFRQGEILARRNQRLPGMFMLIDGAVSISGTNTRNEEGQNGVQKRQITEPGAVLGFSAVLANARALFDIYAETTVCLGFIPRRELLEICVRHPSVLIKMAKRMLVSMPTSLQQAHFVIDWLKFDANQAVYHKGDESEAFYVVTDGRFRSFEDRGLEASNHIEVGRDKSFGAMELYEGAPRISTVRAIRISHVVRIQKQSLRGLAYVNPEFAIRFSETIARSASLVLQQRTPRPPMQSDNSIVQTVAIVALTPSINTLEFSTTLADSVTSQQIYGSAGIPVLTQTTAQNLLGGRCASNITNNATLENYLTQVEDNSPFVIYVSTGDLRSAWSSTCLTRAELIIILADVHNDHHEQSVERYVTRTAAGAQKRLVLLHQKGNMIPPGLTKHWTKCRPWLAEQPWHVSTLEREQTSPDASDSERGKELHMTFDQADIDRITRRILGKSIAVVLGGGGARGIAHLGFLQALEERDIPIDVIGGASIGAFIGTIYAREVNFRSTFDAVQRFSKRLRRWKFLFDLTYPWLSVTSGRRFNYLVHSIFGDMGMNDTRIESYCAVTNLTRGVVSQTFNTGRAWELIRASMSFVGFVPPLGYNGNLLLDGCYSSNLPISFAASLQAHTIFAVDVSIVPDLLLPTWKNELSAWHIAIQRFFSGGGVPPRYTDIVEMLAQGVSHADLQTARTMPGCHYTKMPVAQFSAQTFEKFDEIFQIGYRHAVSWLDSLEEANQLERLCLPRHHRLSH